MARKNRNGFKWLPRAVIGAACAVFLGVMLFFLLRSEPTVPPQPDNDPPKNEYRTEAFYVKDGFLRYADAEHLVGIDVSTHQGVIDWQAVADSGVEFAVIRIGYRGSTVGDLYEDEQFHFNLQGAHDAGLKVGAYFFSQALDAQEAEEEAKYACRLLDGEQLDLPVFYDWEVVGGDSRVTHPGQVDMTACATAFCETVESEGYEAGVYFNQNYGYYHLDLGALQEYMLWLAEYDSAPTFSYHFQCLQYTDSGTVDGIGVGVDLDLLILPEEEEN